MLKCSLVDKGEKEILLEIVKEEENIGEVGRCVSQCEHWTKRSLIVSAQVKTTTPKKTTTSESPHHINDYKIYIIYDYVCEGLLTPMLFCHCANSYVK